MWNNKKRFAFRHLRRHKNQNSKSHYLDLNLEEQHNLKKKILQVEFFSRNSTVKTGGNRVNSENFSFSIFQLCHFSRKRLGNYNKVLKYVQIHPKYDFPNFSIKVWIGNLRKIIFRINFWIFHTWRESPRITLLMTCMISAQNGYF